MTVNIWPHESKLYALIDAEGMRGGDVIIENFDLGEDIKVDVTIKKYKESTIIIQNSIPIKGLKIALNFRKNNEMFLRLDNDHGGLHIHPIGLKEYKLSLSEDTRLSQLISDAFEEAKKILESTFSKQVEDGDDFLGFG